MPTIHSVEHNHRAPEHVCSALRRISSLALKIAAVAEPSRRSTHGESSQLSPRFVLLSAQAVADARLRRDVGRARRGGLELVARVADEDAEIGAVLDMGRPPHLAEDMAGGQHPAPHPPPPPPTGAFPGGEGPQIPP